MFNNDKVLGAWYRVRRRKVDDVYFSPQIVSHMNTRFGPLISNLKPPSSRISHSYSTRCISSSSPHTFSLLIPIPFTPCPQITLNMFSLTPLFNPSAFPPSYSIPALPPSPEIPSNFNFNSSSSSATVFFLGGGSAGVEVGFEVAGWDSEGGFWGFDEEGWGWDIS